MTTRRWAIPLSLLVVGALLGVTAPATADTLCKPAAPAPQSKCVKDAQCCPGLVCQASATDGARCQPGCRIAGQFHSAGAINPANSCQSCQPAVSTTAWTNVANGTGCNADSNGCTQNDSCQGGQCRAGGAPICDDGVSCTTEACQSTGNNTHTCTFTTSANTCLIDGACVAEGAMNPINQCQQCTSSQSQTAYSSKPDGTTCDDGDACTNSDVCTSGACAGTAFDCTPPRIVASSLQEGGVAAAGGLTYTVTFSKPMQAANLDDSDLTFTGAGLGASYTPASSSYDATGTVLTLTYADLPEDAYTLTLLSGDGRFEDLYGIDLDGEAVAWPIPPNVTGDGVAGGNFVLDFSLDVGIAPFPTPLTSEAPPGSMVYDPAKTGVIAPAGDTDSYTINLDPGQVMTVVLAPAPPAATLQPTIQVSDPGANVVASSTASAAGQTAMAETVPILGGGTYTITVGGASGTKGGYSLRLVLNAAEEVESIDSTAGNDTLATAQDLNSAFFSPAAPAGRAAVLGGNEDTGATWSDHYSLSVDAGERGTFALTYLTGGGADLSLEDSSGNVLATGSSGATNVNRSINGYVFTAAGTYYLRVSGDQAATYNLLAVVNGDFDTEPNDSLAGSQSVAHPTVVLGDVGNGGDSDWFGFSVEPGETIIISTSTFAGGPGEFVNTLAPVIQVYDPNGNLVASGASLPGGGSAQITYTAPTRGTYRVAVSAQGATSGEYVMSIGP